MGQYIAGGTCKKLRYSCWVSVLYFRLGGLVSLGEYNWVQRYFGNFISYLGLRMTLLDAKKVRIIY